MDQPNTRHMTDSALLYRSREGDRDALGELLRRTSGHLEWACRSVFSSAAREEHLKEAISEALKDVVVGIGSFRGESMGEFVNWLRTLSRRAAVRVGQKDARRLLVERPASDSDRDEGDAPRSFDPHDPTAWGIDDRVVDSTRLADCLGRLRAARPDQWGSLVLFAEGATLVEIGEYLSTDDREANVQSVKNWLHRARASMRSCLQEGEHGA